MSSGALTENLPSWATYFLAEGDFAVHVPLTSLQPSLGARLSRMFVTGTSVAVYRGGYWGGEDSERRGGS